MRSNPAIEADGVSENFGAVKAVSHLQLSVPSGTIFGLLGPNGAGKSTTVKLLTGMTAPNAGRISVFGKDISRDGVAVKKLIGSFQMACRCLKACLFGITWSL